MKDLTKKGRIIYFDIIRIIAHYSMVIRHNIYAYPYKRVEWYIACFFRSTTPWIIPALLMISGAIFLDEKKEVTLKDIFEKYIKRLIICSIIWSSVYLFLDFDFTQPYTFFDIFKFIFDGYFHLWYLSVAIGMYLFVPILRPIVKDKKKHLYLCAVLGVYSILAFLLNMRVIPESYFLYAGNFGFSSIYVFLFLFGAALYKYDMPKKWRIYTYVLAILSTIAIYVGTSYLSISTNTVNEFFQNCDNPLAVIQAVAIFVFFKQVYKNRKVEGKRLKVVTSLSNACFGIYMVHEAVILILRSPGNSLPLLFFAPIVCLGLFLISYVISVLIKKIPIVGKYIV